MPVKSWSRCRAITSSRATNRPSASFTNRGSTLGTLTRANCRMPVTGFFTSTARLIDRPEMYGNGCEGSTASGVSTGKMRSANSSRIRSFSSVASSCHRRISIPSAARAGRMSSSNSRECSSTSSRVRVRIAWWTSRGISPLTERTATPAAIRRFRPATRTMKNSSRLLAKMARNFARSSSGTRWASLARSSTRLLNANQDSSRS